MRTASQRGIAAVEFALVMPLYFGLLGLGFSAGLAIWTKYELNQIATTAARTCAADIPVALSNFSPCVSSITRTLLLQTSMPSWCTSPTVQVKAPVILSKSMNALQVSMACDGTWLPLANVLPGETLGGSVLSLSVSSSMPYLVVPTPPP